MAEAKFVCSALFAKGLAKTVSEAKNDKYKHCAVSCMLSLRCGPSDAFSLGLMKEVTDLFTDGTAEWADIEANSTGINIAVRRRARTDQECRSSCDDYYPKSPKS